ncbi:peptidase family C50-domain-containing protein [Rhodocollybia butyracea]|uniref:separase n=1 Tax=Rhodocollybia butyracea TaxID=206335 RepID=A0A9P5PW06_9AGAR|nr:peptidase family C50-domain-containing protein [Rhodocollybia butyracea]
MAIATSSRNRKPLAAPPEMKNTRQAATKVPSLPKPISDADRLAAQLAKTLLISDDTKGKGKQKALSVDEQKLRAMRMINNASQKLSDIVQSGWKNSTDEGKKTRPKSAVEALEASTSAARHLALLRDISSNDLNVERAAMSILGKLVALEMYEAALIALKYTHPRLCALAGGEPGHLLSIPNPEIDHDTVLSTLISTYFLNANIILSIYQTSFSRELLQGPTLLEWLPFFSSFGLPEKHLDTILTKTYAALMKVSTEGISLYTLFEIRMYALRCLARTSSGTVQKPDSLWDQACRVASTLIHASSGESILDSSRLVTSSFIGLFTICETRTDYESFVSGKGFTKFCESWIGFASKINAVPVLDKIAGLMSHHSHIPSARVVSDTVKICEPTDNGDLIRKGARMCASFAQLLAVLEQESLDDDVVARIRAVKTEISVGSDEEVSVVGRLIVLSSPRDQSDQDQGRDKDLIRVAGKADRALGRVRRAALNTLEKQVVSKQVLEELSDLLDVVTGVYQSVIETTRPGCNPDHFTLMLDTLFILSRTSLNVLDPRTYGSSYELLARGVKALSLSADSTPTYSVPITGHPDFVRCISGAFYNVGGTLYQAGRYSSAIPFLKEGYRLGEIALSEYDQIKDQPGTKPDPWTQLKEQLWRRSQLLAVCYMKIGDRRPAFDSFIQSVHAFPYAIFVGHIDQIPFGKILDLSNTVKELRSIIEKLTHLGACELMLPASNISLKSNGLPENTDVAVTAILMEWQIESLGSSHWKEGIRDVVVSLLSETLGIYREGCMPVRALRVLVKALEFSYHVPLDNECPEYGWLGLENLEEVTRELYNSEHLGKDAQLAQYRHEYKASIHLWLALHAHRHSDHDQVASANRHTETACAILRSSLGLSVGVPQVAPKPVPKITKRLKLSKTVTSAPKDKSKLPPKGRSTKVPVTPKQSSLPVVEDTVLQSCVPQPSQSLMVDSIERLVNLLQLSAHILGLLSMSLSKISILNVLRKLTERYLGKNSDCYISSSSELAQEYTKLGKYDRAKKVLNQVLSSARTNHVSDETRVLFFLSFAASCAASDDVEQSVKLYQEASVLSERFESPGKLASSTEKIHARVARIAQTAVAYEVSAMIQNSLSNVSGSLNSLLHALRLWNRAFESLGRLQLPTPKPRFPESEANPFEASPSKGLSTPSSNTPQYCPPSQEPSSRPLAIFSQRRILSTGLEWRVAQGLLDVLFSLFRAYLERGSPREAQYFAEQAKALAESLNAPAGMCRALVKNWQIKLFQGLLEEGAEQFEEIERWMSTDEDGDSYLDLAEFYRLKGDLQQRGLMVEDAQKHYEEAMKVIERVNRDFSELDGVEFGPRGSITNTPDSLFPELLVQVVCRCVWLLRAERNETYAKLLERLDSLPLTATVESEKKGLLARLALHNVYQQSRIDMFLSSIGETTIALSIDSNNLNISLSPTSIDIIKSLEHGEKLFWSYLGALGQKGYLPDLRKSVISIAIIKTFQASLGRSDPKTPLLTAGLLDASSSLTLRSELLEAIVNKLPATLHDDLSWPELSDSGSLSPRHPKLTKISDDSDDDVDTESTSLQRYWEAVRQRYQSYVINAATLTSSIVSELPQNWTVVHISVTEDKNTMFISRQRGGSEMPLVFCVPLKGRREDADDEHLTFEDALIEMNEIVHLSNETTKVAASIRNDQTARAKWWKDRGALDTRLRELLENIEFCWLGAFKTILSPNPHLSPEGINKLRIQFDRVFQRGLRLQDKKTKERAIGHRKMPSESWAAPNRVTLDDTLVECFSTLPPDCRDEELEDLVYFILDLYQFHGVPVAIAEIDVDQVVVDLRSVIEEHAQKLKHPGHGRAGAFGYSKRNNDEHLFLVLDKNVQGLPWENIPILRGRSVSRIPSTSFLLDRVQFARLHQPESSGTIDRAVVNPKNAYYIINPSGDLARTEERFQPWLKSLEKVGWQGISGRPPSELEVLNALQSRDLVVYFGHGGAEQYVRSHKLRSLPKCAAVMLWGCSSGALREMGDFDRVGTPLNYMLAGCPTLVANLWDVTDKDIDTFSQSVFDKLNMTADSIKHPPSDHTPMSVVQAVAESRKSCKLKYLTGAAPIVYGIPFYL